MTNAAMIVLFIIYAILYNVIYNVLFIDVFTSHLQHFTQRLFTTFIVAAFLTGITLYLWWIPFMLLLGIAAYAFAGKKKTTLAAVLVIFAVFIMIAGIGFKRQVSKNQQDTASAGWSAPEITMMADERRV